MKRSGWLSLCSRLAVAFGLLFGSVAVGGGGPAFADFQDENQFSAEAPAGTHGSSCVWSMTLFSTVPTVSVNGADYQLLVKCYYDPNGTTAQMGIAGSASSADWIARLDDIMGTSAMNTGGASGFHWRSSASVGGGGTEYGHYTTGGVNPTCSTNGCLRGFIMEHDAESAFFEVRMTWRKQSGSARTYADGGRFRWLDASGNSWEQGLLIDGSGTAIRSANEFVPDLDFDITWPEYRWTSALAPDEDGMTNACTQYSVSGPVGATVLSAGESVPLTVTFDGAADPAEISVQFRRGGPYQVLVSMEYLRTSGVNTVERNVVVPVGDDVVLSDLLIRCIRDGEGPENGTSYQPYGDAGWEGTEGVERACARAILTWPSMLDGDPSQWFEASEPVSFTVRFTGVPSTDEAYNEIVGIEYTEFDYEEWAQSSGESGPRPRGEDASWEAVTGFDGPLVVPGQDSFTIVPTVRGREINFDFRCQDAEGYYYGPQGYWGGPRPPSVERRSEESCYDSIDVGLNPMSWVPGGLRMLSCSLQILFIPSEDALDDFMAEGETLVSERAPMSYIVEVGPVLYSTMADFPSSVEAHDNDCFPGVGGLDEYGFSGAAEICPNEMAAIASLSEWRGIVSVAFWFGALWGLWNATRRLIGDSA